MPGLSWLFGSWATVHLPRLLYSLYPIELFLGYLLLGLLSSLVFRAIRDALPNDPEAQERMLGASFTALALADVGSLCRLFLLA
jgi:hypothetical protein